MTAGREQGDVVDRLRSLVAADVAGMLDLVARLDSVVRRAVAERPSPPAAPGDVLSRLVEAGLSSHAEVDGLVLALLDGLVSAAERALLPAPGTAAPMVDVRVEGRRGDRVACPFVVENRYDEPVEVAFRASALATPGRPDVPAPAVSFEPARLRLGAGASDVAAAVVEVVPLVPGATYATTVEMVGYQGRRLGVTLTVPEDGPTVAGAPTGATGRSRPPAAAEGGDPPTPEAGGPPTVTIERTPWNDVFLLLSGLGLAREAERALADPVAFLRDNRAEARLVARWLEGRGAATATPTRPEPPPPPRPGRRRPTPAEDLRRAPSLLR